VETASRSKRKCFVSVLRRVCEGGGRATGPDNLDQASPLGFLNGICGVFFGCEFGVVVTSTVVLMCLLGGPYRPGCMIFLRGRREMRVFCQRGVHSISRLGSDECGRQGTEDKSRTIWGEWQGF